MLLYIEVLLYAYHNKIIFYLKKKKKNYKKRKSTFLEFSCFWLVNHLSQTDVFFVTESDLSPKGATLSNC